MTGMKQIQIIGLTVLVLMVFTAAGQALDDATKAKVDAKIVQYTPWGTDAKVVEAVKAFNAAPPAYAKDMTHDKWQSLTLLSPEVKAIASCELSKYLKAKKDASISEAFVSGADGTKVAFFAKSSGWSHKGKPKHDDPMAGKTWTGEVEIDASSGQQQVQIGIPVMDQGKAIGSIVIGFNVTKI